MSARTRTSASEMLNVVHLMFFDFSQQSLSHKSLHTETYVNLVSFFSSFMYTGYLQSLETVLDNGLH
jgi:hypothetical protein